MRPWQPAPVADGWLRRVTTGRPARLIGALIVAPAGAGLAGFLFDMAVVLLLERDTLGDFTTYHGPKIIWFPVLAVVSAPAIVAGLLLTQLAFATLRLRSLWAYLAVAAALGTWFTLDLNDSWVTCSTAMGNYCPPPPPADQLTRIILGNAAMALAPALGAAVTFWAVLRPDRGLRS